MATQLTLLDDHGPEPATCAACGQPERDSERLGGLWRFAGGPPLCSECWLPPRAEEKRDAGRP